MANKYFVEYGCYLEKIEMIVTAEFGIHAMRDMIYELAIETTDGWLGMHGFLCGCYDEDTDELSYEDCCRTTIEEAAEYSVTEYSEDIHGDLGHEEVVW